MFVFLKWVSYGLLNVLGIFNLVIWGIIGCFVVTILSSSNKDDNKK